MTGLIRVIGIAALLGAAAATGAPPPESDPAVSLDGVPARSATADAALRDYLQARPARALGFSAQGEVLIRSRFGDTEQLHRVAQAGGERRQLTFGDDPVDWAAFSPAAAHGDFAYLRDLRGNGRYQLYVQRPGEGPARRLSDGQSVNAVPVWSHGGQLLAFTSTARDGRDRDVVIVDADAATPPRLLVSGDGADWRALDWAADDHLLLALRRVSPLDSRLVVIDVASGLQREIDAASGPATIGDARFAADGQGVYYLSDAYADFTQLRYVNIFSGQKSAISLAQSNDIAALAVSGDGRYLAFVSREDLSDRLNLVDLVAHQDLTVPALPCPCTLRDLAFDAEGRRLLFTLASPGIPGDAWVLDVASGAATAWTHSEAGPVDAGRFVAPRLVRIPAFDRQLRQLLHRREVPAYVYSPPAGSVPAARRPVLIELGDGPDLVLRPGFDPWLQYLVLERGYTVVMPALRGAHGFGKDWFAAGLGPLREDAIKDIGAVLVWVRAQRELDAQRVVISGRGTGGSLALDALAYYADRLRGGVAQGAVADLVEWQDVADPQPQAALRALYGDDRDGQARMALRRLSPLANLERLARPMLIAHGRNDADVPLSQADEFVAAARSRSRTAWYLVANDEGHEFIGKRSRDAFLETFAQFLAAAP